MEMALEADHQHHFHVLAVDDSLIDRKLLEKLLKISSYKVTCVESGSKALEYLGLPDNMENSSSSSSFTNQQREVNVNLIITDYCMPGMTGYDLLTRVKVNPTTETPQIFVERRSGRGHVFGKRAFENQQVFGRRSRGVFIEARPIIRYEEAPSPPFKITQLQQQHYHEQQ